MMEWREGVLPWDNVREENSRGRIHPMDQLSLSALGYGRRQGAEHVFPLVDTRLMDHTVPAIAAAPPALGAPGIFRPSEPPRFFPMWQRMLFSG